MSRTRNDAPWTTMSRCHCREKKSSAQSRLCKVSSCRWSRGAGDVIVPHTSSRSAENGEHASFSEVVDRSEHPGAGEAPAQSVAKETCDVNNQPNDVIARFLRECCVSHDALPVPADARRLNTLRCRTRCPQPPHEPSPPTTTTSTATPYSIYDITHDGDMSAYAADVTQRRIKSQASRSRLLLTSTQTSKVKPESESIKVGEKYRSI